MKITLIRDTRYTEILLYSHAMLEMTTVELLEKVRDPFYKKMIDRKSIVEYLQSFVDAPLACGLSEREISQIALYLKEEP